MKNMVLLIDTNIILDYLTNRNDAYLPQSVVNLMRIYTLLNYIITSNHIVFIVIKRGRHTIYSHWLRRCGCFTIKNFISVM